MIKYVIDNYVDLEDTNGNTIMLVSDYVAKNPEMEILRLLYQALDNSDYH